MAADFDPKINPTMLIIGADEKENQDRHLRTFQTNYLFNDVIGEKLCRSHMRLYEGLIHTGAVGFWVF